jgi:predicted flap endonuclease-1-like 5' DNA nuclease
VIWLFGEIWAWILAGFLLGVLVGWWIWARNAPPVIVEPALVNQLRAELDGVNAALARSESDLGASQNARKALETSLAAAGMPVTPLFLEAPDGPADDLTVVRGVGPRLAVLLNSLGIFHLRQIARWSDADIAEIDTRLGAFKGRIARDNWVEQAKLLIDGDVAVYQQRFGDPHGEGEQGGFA